MYHQKRPKRAVKPKQRFASSSHETTEGHDPPKAAHALGLLTPRPGLRTRLRPGYAYVSVEPKAPSLGRHHRARGRRAMPASSAWPQEQSRHPSRQPGGRGRLCVWRAREAGHSPGSSRGPGAAETYSRTSPRAPASAGAAPAPGGSAPGPSAIACAVLAAAAAAASHPACTPSCRRWYPRRKRRAPGPGTGHGRALPLGKATLRGRLGAARRDDVALGYRGSNRRAPAGHAQSLRPPPCGRVLRSSERTRGAVVTGSGARRDGRRVRSEDWRV